MGVTVSQITSLIIVYSAIYSGTDQKTSKLNATGLCEVNSPVTGEFPSQRASNMENDSILWCDHAKIIVAVSSTYRLKSIGCYNSQ